MFGIKGKMISAERRILQILKLSCVLIDEDCDDSAVSMPKHAPYKQAKQARLEAELKIAETYAWHWRRKNKTI